MTYHNEGHAKNIRCLPADLVARLESNQPEFNYSNWGIEICNDTQLSLLERLDHLAEKRGNATAFPYKLMNLLGLPKRFYELLQKDADLQRQYGLIVDIDEEKAEL